MNCLIEKMSSDMHIHAYQSETTEMYISRVLYSALGMWCLQSVCCNKIEDYSISKKEQTSKLEELKIEYCELFPFFSNYICDPKEKDVIAKKVRILYENTGYFNTNVDNRNQYPSFKRVISLGGKNLVIGDYARNGYEMNGLGTFTNHSVDSEPIKNFILRDSLFPCDFVDMQYDICDFEERDIDIDALQFFNPIKKSTPSKSWDNTLSVDYSIARKGEYGPYYYVRRSSEGTLLYKSADNQNGKHGMFSQDFRRMYFALRAYYDNPLPVWINDLDAQYSKITIPAKLPMREYNLLLLSGWPESNAFHSNSYLIKNEIVDVILELFVFLGFDIKR